MKTIEEMTAVMKAFQEGKEIEYSENGGRWNTATAPCWNWYKHDYRVKPEPKYRPYANAIEFLKDSKEHGPIVKGKDDELFFLPVSISDRTVMVINCDSYYTYEKLKEHFTWQDGTPCGVKEDENL